MTDMPFVAAMTGAMGLLLNGLNTHEDERVRVYEVDAFGTTVAPLALAPRVRRRAPLRAAADPLSRSRATSSSCVWGDGPKGFRFHWDEFKSGSATQLRAARQRGVRDAQPGVDPEVGRREPERRLAVASSATSAASSRRCRRSAGAFVLGGALYLNWGERRTRRLLYIAAWLCAAIATMAKGPAGFGLPMLCAFAYVATKRRWSELLRLEIMTGLLVILAVAMPWYVAMYVRHGSPFTDRLIFHDMFNRAFSHVHDTNEGDDTGIRFYLWQLGYALFPWTGLAPLGLIWGFRRSDSAHLARSGPPRCAAGSDRRRPRRGRRRRRRRGHARDVVPLRVRPLHVHGHEVPPLHLPGRAAGGDADRRRARRHARRATARRARRSAVYARRARRSARRSRRAGRRRALAGSILGAAPGAGRERPASAIGDHRGLRRPRS